MVSQVFGPPVSQVSEGYVDKSGIIQSLPQDVTADRLVLFENIGDAHQALEAGEISAYYFVPEDYLSEGEILYIRGDYNPLAGIDQAQLFRNVLRFNLLDGDVELFRRLEQPLRLERVNLTEQPERDSSSALTFFLPYIVTMLFYIVILSAAGFMLNSVTTEKQNRVLEILMVSITPLQMLTGKIIALGLVGLLQTIVWSGAGLMLLRISGRSLNLPPGFQLPVSILGWGAIFFLLGYAVYASIMAGIGALVPNLREASQATTVVILPMIIPLLLIGPIIENPNGTLAVALSLFPLTAPVTMMTRLASGNVPVIQPIVSIVILLATSFIAIRMVAGLFRAQVLLSGQSFNLKRLFRAFAGKVV
jgi:ABC-2 type transport system permease protein